MSGSSAMYTLNPIMSAPSLTKHKNVMYELKNIHEIYHQSGDHSPPEDTIFSQITDQVTKLLKESSSELKVLEARQERILSQLAEIKQQVAIFRDVLNQKSSTEAVNHTPVNIDIILNANPKKTPFSILALAKIWTDSVFQIQFHVHSTIIGSVPKISLPKDVKNTPKNVINVRLIWKDVPDLQLKCELTACSVEGEVNFLRYLSRVVKSHNYERSDFIDVNLIDSILDFCYILSHESINEAQSSISKLNDHLTKGPWLLNKKEPSIADVAVWSLVKRLNFKLPSKLAKWFENCEKTFL